MSEELTAEEFLKDKLNIKDFNSLKTNQFVGEFVLQLLEEYTKAKTEEKDNDIEILKLVNQGFREANVSLGEEVDELKTEPLTTVIAESIVKIKELQKEVERLERHSEYDDYRLRQIKDTLRLTGNFYKCRNKETAFNRAFIKSEQYIKELLKD
jgi:hypothetical protein